jgi:hypothetical protein
MVFRIEARAGAILILAAIAASGQTFAVRHQHTGKDGPGELKISDTGIVFTEAGKKAKPKHSRTWKYGEIQQLELSPERLRILTYEDVRLTGRDREYVFVDLPAGFAKAVYPQWRDKLDRRFIAALPDSDVQTIVEFPAKLGGTFKGVEGMLRFGEDRIVFETARDGESRTWRFSDIDNIASAGPFDFSLTTPEHHGVWNAGTREFRFQLQKPMEEARFDELWRKLFRQPLTESRP